MKHLLGGAAVKKEKTGGCTCCARKHSGHKRRRSRPVTLVQRQITVEARGVVLDAFIEMTE